MFDIGFGELMVVAFVAVVLLGGERCVKIFREIGKFLRRIEKEWNETIKHNVID